MDLILKRHKKRCQGEKESKKISNIFSKILLSIIFILLSCIYINLKENNLQTYKKVVLEDNLSFTKINNLVQKTFGNIMTNLKTNEAVEVNNEINLKERVPYQEGYQIKTTKDAPIEALKSGILVYLGEKENYGQTAIIQGVDGIDIWYGNITNVSLKLYDYVEENTIIASAASDVTYEVYYQNESKITYEEAFKKVANQ